MLLYEEFESRGMIPRIYGQVLRLPPSVIRRNKTDVPVSEERGQPSI